MKYQLKRHFKILDILKCNNPKLLRVEELVWITWVQNYRLIRMWSPRIGCKIISSHAKDLTRMLSKKLIWKSKKGFKSSNKNNCKTNWKLKSMFHWNAKWVRKLVKSIESNSQTWKKSWLDLNLLKGLIAKMHRGKWVPLRRRYTAWTDIWIKFSHKTRWSLTLSENVLHLSWATTAETDLTASLRCSKTISRVNNFKINSQLCNSNNNSIKHSCLNIQLQHKIRSKTYLCSS